MGVCKGVNLLGEQLRFTQSDHIRTEDRGRDDVERSVVAFRVPVNTPDERERGERYRLKYR